MGRKIGVGVALIPVIGTQRRLEQFEASLQEYLLKDSSEINHDPEE